MNGLGAVDSRLAEPNDHGPGLGVDFGHAADLVALFGEVALVDAYCVDPEDALDEGAAQMRQGCVEVCPDGEAVSVEEDGEWLFFRSPDVRKGFVRVAALRADQRTIEELSSDGIRAAPVWQGSEQTDIAVARRGIGVWRRDRTGGHRKDDEVMEKGKNGKTRRAQMI